MERKIAAILCADVAGYSRLMGQNEVATLATLTAYRKIIDSLIEGHRGRFVNSAGDSVLAEFGSVVNAMECATRIQTALKLENAVLPPERRMELRIGVNLGDVMVEGEQLYGDGVNVAARLESLAEPGGICISHTVHDHIRNKLPLSYADLGPLRVKNIAEPVRVFRVLNTPDTRRYLGSERIRKLVRRGALSFGGIAILVGTIVLVQHLSLRPPAPSASIPPIAKPALGPPDMPSIAVLPFTNLSSDPKQDYFSDGITDYLITDLSRLPNLLVIARNSTFAYKGKAISVRQVGQELGVRTVLEGSVFKAPSQVRITVQLADATTGANLWAARFDKPLSDVFTVQDEIVREIVTTLNLLSKAREMKLPPGRVQPTNNLEAFDYWLKGVEETDLTKQGYLRRRGMFEKAIALDSNYADAYAALAFTYLNAAILQYDKDPIKSATSAVELAQQAIVRDDQNWLAYMVLGEVYGWKREYDRAVVSYKRAIALDPNNPSVYYWFGDVLALIGKPAETVSAAEKAIRLDPQNADIYAMEIGQGYNWMGEYTKALPFLKRHASRFPDNLMVHYELAYNYASLGRYQEAKDEAAEVMRLNPKFSLEVMQKPRCPFKDEEICIRYRTALRKAGLK